MAQERKDPTMRYIAKRDLWRAIALQCALLPADVKAWRRVPREHVLAVERAIGRPRQLIRPDIHRKQARSA